MKILKQLDLNNVVFLDIETVPLVQELIQGTPLYESWEYKVRHNKDTNAFTGTLNESYVKNAALYAEFSKIVTIVIGKIKDGSLMLKTYTNTDEQQLLNDFCKDLNNICTSNKNTRLAGHAIKGFDIPFIMRRCLVNQIELPALIDIAHLKPWELTAIDTLELWKGSGFSGSSLINIATALNIPSPKDEMEGEDTYTYYYTIKDGLQLIEKYCIKDVRTVCDIILKCRFEKPLGTEQKIAELVQEKQPALVTKVFNGKQPKDIVKLIQKVNALPADEVEAGNLILQAINGK